ncbi:MAG: flagellar protein FlaG [Spirochaetaceae bacterium]|nr:flagellar protein FlaG [Spirochaetaceae bacterium]
MKEYEDNMNLQISKAGGGEQLEMRRLQQDKQRSRVEALSRALPANSGNAAEREAAAARLRKITGSFNKKLQYEVDHKSGEITVKVIDGATDKVLKVLPPEELQRLRHAMDDAVAILLDEKV